MSDSSRHYNAVTYLLDRNVDQGRGNKVVFKDPVAEITYGELQAQTRRFANLRSGSVSGAKSASR